MIKKEELRIGNYFNFHPIGCNSIIDKVISLKSESKKGWYRIKGEKSGWNQESQCHPIPLTHLIFEQLLEQCGFISYDNPNNTGSIIHNLNDFKIINHKNGTFSIKDSQSIYFKYLHQLQNLYFALTGEELNVNLNVAAAI